MRLEELIDHLGEVIGDKSVSLDANKHVAFTFEDVILHLYKVPEHGAFLAHADIGELPQDGREAFMEQVLRTNWNFQGTGGANLAINNKNGKLALSQYWFEETMTKEKFIEVLNRFLQVIQDWEGILRDYRPSETNALPYDTPSGITPNEVRIFL